MDDSDNMKSIQLSIEGSDLGTARGYAFLLRAGDHFKEGSGGSPIATGPRMELLAVVVAFRMIKEPCNVLIIAHSSFLIDAIAALPKWHDRGWKSALNPSKDLKYIDLWAELFELISPHIVSCQRVEGDCRYLDSARCEVAADLARIQAAQTGVPFEFSSTIQPEIVIQTHLEGDQSNTGVSGYPPPSTMTGATVSTDGACVNNPGPGGWAFVARREHAVMEQYGSVPDTTNNRMELMAGIEGLKAVDAIDPSCEILLKSDSQYLLMGLESWRHKWALQGWMRGKPGNKVSIPNADLWRQLHDLAEKHAIICQWVRGHTGNVDNERCDKLAEDAAEALADTLGTIRRRLVRRRPRRA